MALLLRADGTAASVCPKDSRYTLEELQEIVGGNILHLLTDDDGLMIGREFDYQGQILELKVPVNVQATIMYRRWTRNFLAQIHGNVILVPIEEMG